MRALYSGMYPRKGVGRRTPTVMLEEDAMTRLESSAWNLAGGSGCVFALAVVLNHLPWQAATAVVIIAVVTWAWRGPLIAGAAIGGIAWLCVTGFDVYTLGEIKITGSDDVTRAAAPVLSGVLAASVHAVMEARRRYRRADPLWAEFHETTREPNETAEDFAGRFAHEIACRPGATESERPFR
jgi:hypothetical protein